MISVSIFFFAFILILMSGYILLSLDYCHSFPCAVCSAAATLFQKWYRFSTSFTTYTCKYILSKDWVGMCKRKKMAIKIWFALGWIVPTMESYDYCVRFHRHSLSWVVRSEIITQLVSHETILFFSLVNTQLLSFFRLLDNVMCGWLYV